VQVRRTVLDAAERLFAERGYAGATSRDLARAAGVSESVMYRHFGSKAGLFAEAVVEPFLRFLENFSEVSARYLSQPLPVPVMMRLFVSELVEQLTRHRTSLRTVLAASEDLEADTKQALVRGLDSVLVRLGDVVALEQGLRRRPGGVLGPEMDVRAVVGMVLSLVVLDDWLLPAGDRRPSQDQLVDHLTRFLLDRPDAPDPDAPDPDAPDPHAPDPHAPDPEEGP
jgi:AcrR family transcriptional regulator